MGQECKDVDHQDLDIEDIKIHPEYRGKRNFFKHDIALIRLKTKVKRNGMLVDKEIKMFLILISTLI